ncbi:MAG: arylsulfatase [Planctomycetota bacterium]
MRRGLWTDPVITVVITCLLFGSSTTQRSVGEEPETQRANVLLIVADDLGFSDLGCFGSEIQTPNLNQLADGGLRLTQFYTTGRCCPSRASILTGYYPHRVGLGHMTKDLDRPGYRGSVSPYVKTIAERLTENGYRCYLSGKWHLGTKDPTRHGFEEFYGTLTSAKTFWDPNHMLRLPSSRIARSYEEDEFYATDALVDHAIDFVRLSGDEPDQPWFLYLAFNAPHFPLHAPKETIAKYSKRYHDGWDSLRDERLARMKSLGVIPDDTQLTPRSPYYDWGSSKGANNPAWDSLPKERRADLSRRMAIYAAMIDRMDQNIGRLIKELKNRGEFDKTLIVFTSDNGACAEWDAFGFDIQSGPNNVLHQDDEIDRMGSAETYHSVGSGWANASNTPWRLYKHFNHEGGIAVPCILHWPDRMTAPAGSINRTPTHLIDFFPTLLEASGIDSEDVPIDLPGRSLVPLLEEESLNDRILYFEHEGNRAVRHGRWKLVALRNQPWKLYDMRVDRTELNDVSKEHPFTTKRLTQMWNAWAEINDVTPLPNDYGVEYLPVLSSESEESRSSDK